MSEVMTAALSTLKAEPLSWLWPGRIARGKLTLLCGDPGQGKSFLTLDIAARVARAGAWPDGPTPLREPGSVLLLSAEDDAADTIRPRLEACGCSAEDLARIEVVEGVDRPEGRMLGQVALDRDTAGLARRLNAMTRPRLMVIDPISAYMGEADSHNNAQVRATLAPLARLAQQTGVAVVAVTHLAKQAAGPSSRAVYRAMGSLAFTAAARMVWMVGTLPDEPETRTLALVKSNLQVKAQGLRFRVTPPAEDPTGYARVEWLGACDLTSADALEDQEAYHEQQGVREAVRFLREALAEGPLPANEVLRQAEQANISATAVRRARSRAGVVTMRQGGPDGGSVHRPWVWALPQEHDRAQTSPARR